MIGLPATRCVAPASAADCGSAVRRWSTSAAPGGRIPGTTSHVPLGPAQGVDGGEIRSQLPSRLDGAGYRARDVVPLEVQENLYPAILQRCDHRGPGLEKQHGANFGPPQVGESVDQMQRIVLG